MPRRYRVETSGRRTRPSTGTEVPGGRGEDVLHGTPSLWHGWSIRAPLLAPRSCRGTYRDSRVSGTPPSALSCPFHRPPPSPVPSWTGKTLVSVMSGFFGPDSEVDGPVLVPGPGEVLVKRLDSVFSSPKTSRQVRGGGRRGRKSSRVYPGRPGVVPTWEVRPCPSVYTSP